MPEFDQEGCGPNISVEERAGEDSAVSGDFRLRRLWPLALLGAFVALFFVFDLNRFVTFEALRAHRHVLTAFVETWAVLAILAFIAAYAIATLLSLPGGAILTVAGGFMFGTLAGTFWVVIGATIGATLIFLVAKTSLGDQLRARAGPFFKTMEQGFRENAFSYLLVLRLVPIFPFFIVNLVPAFLGVSLRDYVLATFIGIVPGTFVFASVGAGLGSVFDANQSFSLEGVLTPEIVVALVGLSLLSCLPIVFKKVKARRATA